ncbi:uncharacterized protein LOC132190961 [Corylus avellana]|uniref:uncharacterized protein LOC132190961 n=1 Tax=Corylus avellana TaxID=13451 RepID=UPI00286BB1F4|nr:uncharacterized protein LOC132190961 [Corylus avellana]
MRCLGQRSYRSYSELGFKEKGENSSDGDETASSGLNILELKGSLTDGKNSTRGEESVEQSELLKFERWAEKRETNDAEVKYSGKASDQNSKRFKLGLRLGALGGHHILGGFVCASEAKFAFRRIRKFSSCGRKPGTDIRWRKKA